VPLLTVAKQKPAAAGFALRSCPYAFEISTAIFVFAPSVLQIILPAVSARIISIFKKFKPSRRRAKIAPDVAYPLRWKREIKNQWRISDHVTSCTTS
jgi:hypothetical protein